MKEYGMSTKFIAKRIDMKKIKSTNDLIDLFLLVAKNYPNQANKLFNRYAADIRRHHYKFYHSRAIAARNLRMLADSRGVESFKLLVKTIPSLRHR